MVYNPHSKITEDGRGVIGQMKTTENQDQGISNEEQRLYILGGFQRHSPHLWLSEGDHFL